MFKPYPTDLQGFTDLLPYLVYPADKITQKPQPELVFVTMSLLWCNSFDRLFACDVLE
jgi:hypothetical protein